MSFAETDPAGYEHDLWEEQWDLPDDRWLDDRPWAIPDEEVERW
jgi:hypothetical protein